ncbi:MAG: carbon-nitrogen hydrolase family protein [Actinomycetia bacterium]|nr:carbon-nitrogen hydrolase family protein [Actinomycetes bacterium]
MPRSVAQGSTPSSASRGLRALALQHRHVDRPGRPGRSLPQGPYPTARSGSLRAAGRRTGARLRDADRAGRHGDLLRASLPESARSLALAGADVIAQPANIGVGGPEIVIDLFARVRACENSVFLAVANRPDAEGSYRFCGKSAVVAPNGDVLARACEEPALIVAEADLALAGTKYRDIRSNGTSFTVELFGDRRPEHYRALTRRDDRPDSVPGSLPPRRQTVPSTGANL